MTEDSKILKWINCAKFLAIFAVVIDHCGGLLYTNSNVRLLTYFSVTVFTFLGGYTSFLSCQRHEQESYWKVTWHRVRHLLIPFVFASVVYYLDANHFFRLTEFIRELFSFSIPGTPHFYFVLFYIQLLLIVPLLYEMICDCKKSGHPRFLLFILLSALLIASTLSEKYTEILPIYGGGQYLFGGSYLFIFAMGMTAAFMNNIKLSQRELARRAGILFLFMLCWIFVMLRVDFSNFNSNIHGLFYRVNPPGIQVAVYGLLTVSLFRYVLLLINSFAFGTKFIITPLNILGKYSYSIFLYHLFWIELIKPEKITHENLWLYRLFIIAGAVLFPVFCKITFTYLVNLIQRRRNEIDKIKED